jgi:hypothetical protein
MWIRFQLINFDADLDFYFMQMRIHNTGTYLPFVSQAMLRTSLNGGPGISVLEHADIVRLASQDTPTH